MLGVFVLSGCNASPGTTWNVVALLDICGPTRHEGRPQLEALAALESAASEVAHSASPLRLAAIDTRGNAGVARCIAGILRDGAASSCPTGFTASCARDLESLSAPSRDASGASALDVDDNWCAKKLTSCSTDELIRAFGPGSRGAPVAVIGPSNSDESLKVVKIFAGSIPTISLAASRDIVCDGKRPRSATFKIPADNEAVSDVLVRTIIADGHHRVVVMSSDDAFGRQGSKAFVDRAAAGIASSEPCSRTVNRSSSQALRVVQTVRFPEALPTTGERRVGKRAMPSGSRSKIWTPVNTKSADEADAVVVWGTTGTPELVQRLRKHRPTWPIYLSHANASLQQLRQTGDAIEDVTIVGYRVLVGSTGGDDLDGQDLTIDHFRAFWSAAFSEPPSPYGGFARDALFMLLEGLRRLHDRDPMLTDVKKARSGLAAELEQLRPFFGVTGSYRFSAADHGGPRERALEVYRIIRGEFVPVARVSDRAGLGDALASSP